MKIFKTIFQVALLLAILTILMGADSCHPPKQVGTAQELEKAFIEGYEYGYVITQNIPPVNKNLVVKNGITVELQCAKNYGAHKITLSDRIDVDEGGVLNLGSGSGTYELTIINKSTDLITNFGTVSVSDGVILSSSNYAIWNGGQLDMNGGKIHGGGVYNSGDSILNMRGGLINYSSGNGVDNYGEFTMQNAEICFNNGHGVYNGRKAKFTMNGVGLIYSNNLSGVYNTGNFIMQNDFNNIRDNLEYGLYNDYGAYEIFLNHNGIFSNSKCNIWSNGICHQ